MRLVVLFVVLCLLGCGPANRPPAPPQFAPVTFVGNLAIYLPKGMTPQERQLCLDAINQEWSIVYSQVAVALAGTFNTGGPTGLHAVYVTKGNWVTEGGPIGNTGYVEGGAIYVASGPGFTFPTLVELIVDAFFPAARGVPPSQLAISLTSTSPAMSFWSWVLLLEANLQAQLKFQRNVP